LAISRSGTPAEATHRRGHKIDWKLGMKNGLRKATKKAAANAAKLRDDCYSFLLEDVQAWRQAGDSYRTIAERLNCLGHVTTSGKAFAPMTVQRILK
jgi:hypothetical protein